MRAKKGVNKSANEGEAPDGKRGEGGDIQIDEHDQNDLQKKVLYEVRRYQNFSTSPTVRINGSIPFLGVAVYTLNFNQVI